MPSDILMPLAQYGVLVLFIVAMVGSPGPANMSLMASGVAFGARPAEDEKRLLYRFVFYIS